MDSLYNVKVKDYLYHTEYRFSTYTRYLTNPENEKSDISLFKHFVSDKEKNINDSFHRAYNSLRDIVLSNPWDYFCTFTFKSEKYRNDYELIVKTMRNFFREIKRKYDPFIKYVYVIEPHKKSGFHIHALLYGIDESNLEIAQFNDKDLYINGKLIFHYKPYKKGFQSISLIDDREKTCNYILKYISKSIFEYGNRAYYCSQGLNKPTVRYFYDKDFDINRTLPTINEEDYIDVYHCEKMNYDTYFISRKKI